MSLIKEFEKNIKTGNKTTLNDFIVLYQSLNEISKYCFDNNIDLGRSGWGINLNLVALEPVYSSYIKTVENFIKNNGEEKDGKISLNHTSEKGKEFLNLDKELKEIERDFPPLEKIEWIEIPARMLIILQRYNLVKKDG